MTLDLFAEDIHASHSVLPGSKQARQTTVISGQKCIGLLKLSGRDGLLPRMLLGTSIWASTLCYLTWKPKTTPGGRLLFQLAPLMPNTDEIGSGLLPTPTNSERATFGKGSPHVTKNGTVRRRNENGTSSNMGLTATLMATPRSCSAMASSITENRAKDKFPNLEVQVAQMMWPTPVTRDGKDQKICEGNRGWDTIAGRLADFGHVGFRLNPLFVEQMMGFPEQWTDLNVSETPPSPKSPKSSAEQ